jgi:hypothetical protein
MRTIVIILTLLHGAPALAGASMLRPAAPSMLVMEGSSNVTGWKCRGTTLAAEMSVAASIEKINAVIDRIEDGNIGVWMSNPHEGRFPQPKFAMQIPIATLKCGNRGIERDMSRALKADLHPVIEFRFIELLGPIDHDLDSNVYRARIAGEIVLAGTSRTVDVVVTAVRVDRERFRIQAEVPLRMTDFGITPPTVLLGVIKVKDELNVRFDLMLQVQA